MISRESLIAMNTKTAAYLMLYGAFLIIMGLLGYLSNPEKAQTALMSIESAPKVPPDISAVCALSNPEKAQTALMSGGTFGALSIVWGVLGARGVRWSLPAAVVTTG